MEDLKEVLSAPIPANERILWSRIFITIGYNSFVGAQPDVAALFGMNVWTFKSQLKGLRERGAITVSSRYKKDRTVPAGGSRYKLVPPSFWLEGSAPV